MNLDKFLYQLRKKEEEFYIARLNLSVNSPLEFKKIDSDKWEQVSPWESGANSTAPCSEWLERNQMKNYLYVNGIKNYLL